MYFPSKTVPTLLVLVLCMCVCAYVFVLQVCCNKIVILSSLLPPNYSAIGEIFQGVILQTLKNNQSCKGCYSGCIKFTICTIKLYSQSEPAEISVQILRELLRMELRIQSEEGEN